MKSRKSGGKAGPKVQNIPPKLPFLRPPDKPRRLTNQLEFWKTQIQNIWKNKSSVPFRYPVKPEEALVSNSESCFGNMKSRLISNEFLIFFRITTKK